MENLHLSWKEFKKGKSKKEDVRLFKKDLQKNIFNLHDELTNLNYRHAGYFSFYIKDPKLRHIHKACVKDRVLHHAIFRILYPIFDKMFIFDSYSCRTGKGTHRAIFRLREFFRKASKNNNKTCYVLKCDIKKFFNSIDQDILLNLIENKIKDDNVIWLIKIIIKSFPAGLPLGNITSQLFANIYLNELDQYVKHDLKTKYYIRYCDDLIIISSDKKFLGKSILAINDFLKNKLRLQLHPNKVFIKTLASGIDFLGWVNFYNHRILRKSTRKRMFRKLLINSTPETLNSYFGLIKHGNTYKIRKEIFKIIS